MSALEFKNVTAVAKANVYFEGKVVSHTILLGQGEKRTLGLIFPGEFHFGTDAAERMDILSQHDAIWGCTFVGECTRVCPKHVDPAGAIQQYKLTAALDWVKSVVMPWGGK